MIDISKDLASLRDEESAIWEAVKNLRKDGDRVKSRADRLWGAYKMASAVAVRFNAYGLPLEPHIVEQIISDSFDDFKAGL